jgi:heme exporter protein D
VSEFLGMGGYAFYVWGSFGATVAVLAWNVVAPRLERGRLRRKLREEAAS